MWNSTTSLGLKDKGPSMLPTKIDKDRLNAILLKYFYLYLFIIEG